MWLIRKTHLGAADAKINRIRKPIILPNLSKKQVSQGVEYSTEVSSATCQLGSAHSQCS